jgi:hypothetical protein
MASMSPIAVARSSPDAQTPAFRATTHPTSPQMIRAEAEVESQTAGIARRSASWIRFVRNAW